MLGLLALGAAPRIARAQQTGKTHRVGFVFSTSDVATMAGPNPAHPYARVFVHEMRDRGYVEGRNLDLQRRSLEGKVDQGPEVMAELVGRKVDVIVAGGNPAIAAATRATATIPIVMSNSVNPVGAGFIASGPPEHGPGDYTGAFTVIAREHADALITATTTHNFTHRSRLAEAALKQKVPSMMTWSRDSVEAGGLMSYAADNRDNWRRVAIHVEKILKGAKPGDLPVEQPVKFEMVVNLKTAKALGLTIANSIMLRADEVIQ